MSMGALKPGVIGDTCDTRVIELVGLDANALDTVVTIQGHFTRGPLGPYTVTGTVNSSPLSKVNIPVGTFLALATTIPGTWEVEVELDTGLSTELTFPGGTPSTFPVRGQIG